MDRCLDMWQTSLAMSRNEESSHVVVGRQGRVVIPAELRRRLGVEPGQTLVAREEDGRLVLERPANVLARLRRRFAEAAPDTSLADELIAERRREARVEEGPADEPGRQ